ncbi:MAG: TlpA disulfide reductase family protein [Clostridia bacterium]
MKKYALIIASILALTLALSGCLGDMEEYIEPTPEPAVSDPEVSAEPTEGDTAEPQIGIKEGMLAPDFTLTLTDGTDITLSDLRGSVVLLNFWATWCNPCVGEMPHIQQMSEDYPDVSILAVNVSESAEDAAAFMSENGLDFPVAVGGNDLSKLYDLQTIPRTLILDEDGVIAVVIEGSLSAEQFSTLLEAVMG